MGQHWYLHLQGESLGPWVTDVVHAMLKQNRIEHYDFIWTEGMSQWTRICDVDEFSRELPRRPSTPVPSFSPNPDPAVPPAAEPPASAHLARTDAPWRHKRHSPRVSMEGNVEIPDVGRFPLVNISETGLFVQAATALAVGTEVKFTILSPEFGTPLEMTGVVMRAGAALGRTGFAIEFTRVNPSHRRAISVAVAKSRPS